MPNEYEGLQGRTGESAVSLFERSRQTYAGETPNHRANDLALACPICRSNGDPESRMFTRANAGYYCLKGHKWNDLDDLMAQNPAKLQFKGIKARQEGYRQLNLEMPGSTLDALQAKYKEKLPETLAAFIEVLTNSRFLIVGEEDLVRIEQNVGIAIRNGRDLSGATFERAQKIRDLQESVDKGGSADAPVASFNIPGVVMINVLDVMPQLEERAKNADPPRSVPQFLSDTVREYVRNNWF